MLQHPVQPHLEGNGGCTASLAWLFLGSVVLLVINNNNNNKIFYFSKAKAVPVQLAPSAPCLLHVAVAWEGGGWVSSAAELKNRLKAARCELPLLSPRRCRAGVICPQKERNKLTGPWHVGEQSSFMLYARAFVVGDDKSGWHGRIVAFARTSLVLKQSRL